MAQALVPGTHGGAATVTFDSLPSTVRDKLSDVRAAFKAEWNAGTRPDFGAYLSGRTEPERTILFEMLLEVDIESRRDAGERPSRRDYIEQFCAYTEVIHTIFGDPVIVEETEFASALTTEPSPNESPPTDQATTLAHPAWPTSRSRQQEPSPNGSAVTG